MSNKNKLIDNFKKEELVRLFEAMFIPKLSITCFMALMCGLRVREICRLKVEDIDLKERVIKIEDSKNPNRKKQGDYGKDRKVPIPMIAISPIKKWLSIIEGGKYFIPSEKSPDSYLKPKTLHEWFKQTRIKAGLNQVEYEVDRKTQPKMRIYKFRFHHLRHFYATMVYERTRDLFAVQKLLGHERPETTEIYAKVNSKILKETVDFAFDTPLKAKVFQENPANALNYNIPTIKQSQKERTPVEILEERFAKGEISAPDFQTALRLLKIRKEYLNDQEKQTDNESEVEVN